MKVWPGLDGAAVVVAGAGGLGTAIAGAFSSLGARVAVVDADRARAEATAGDEHVALAADLRDPEACRAALRAAHERLGRLDVFVHAVGTNLRQPVESFSDAQWREILDVNLSSAWWTAQAAGALMRAQGGGRIVFLSSVSGLLAHKHHAPYAATKGGINQMMRVMAHEWAADGVGVNAVAPGYVETPLTAAHLAKPGVREDLERLVPAGRLGVPQDVADAVVFLASPRASFITGQILYVDGGRTLV